MNIDDRMLSAFLDAQLSEQDMESVRTALETDDSLVIRLAELSEVDSLVLAHAKAIDNMPLSGPLADTVKQLTPSNNIAQLNLFQRIKKSTHQSFAIAASIAVVFGVAIFSNKQMNTSDHYISAEVKSVLDNQLSTEMVTTKNGSIITSNLSFANQQGELCRLYNVKKVQNQQTAIACNTPQGWEIKVSTLQEFTGNSNDYQTASKNAVLDSYIDTVIKGQPFDRKQEQNAIELNWQHPEK